MRTKLRDRPEAGNAKSATVALAGRSALPERGTRGRRPPGPRIVATIARRARFKENSGELAQRAGVRISAFAVREIPERAEQSGREGGRKVVEKVVEKAVGEGRSKGNPQRQTPEGLGLRG